MNFGALALFAWLIAFVLLYRKFRDPRAYFLTNMLGAWLFLPESSVDLYLLPDLTKYTAFSIPALISVFKFGRRDGTEFRLKKWDWPMLVFCTVPIFTSLDNDLGLWDGLSSSINTFLIWGVPYYLGRRYFRSIADLEFILLGVAAAVVAYLPFIWFEVIMSPRLHQIVYGYNQADWVEHIRYGGWRPKVFMQHGLMLAFFVSISVLAVSALRDRGIRTKIAGTRLSVIEKILMVTVVACKSGNGFVILVMTILARVMKKAGIGRVLLLSLVLLIPSYLTARIGGYWDGTDLVKTVESVSDAQRAGSLRARMVQEDIFLHKAEQKWLFGWGGWARAFPVNEYGIRETRGVDSLWIIVYSQNGLIALVSLYWVFLAAPFVVATRARTLALESRERSFVYMVSFIPIFFMVDCLVNAMVSPLYPMVAGSLTAVLLNVQGQYHGSAK